MGFWIKLDDGTVVSYQEMADYNYSYYDKSQRVWIKAPPEIEEKAKEKLIAMAESNPNDFWLAQFLTGLNQPPPEEPNPPKPKRKELMRRIAELEEESKARDENFKHLIAQRDAEIERSVKLESEVAYWKKKAMEKVLPPLKENEMYF